MNSLDPWPLKHHLFAPMKPECIGSLSIEATPNYCQKDLRLTHLSRATRALLVGCRAHFTCSVWIYHNGVDVGPASVVCDINRLR